MSPQLVVVEPMKKEGGASKAWPHKAYLEGLLAEQSPALSKPLLGIIMIRDLPSEVQATVSNTPW